MLGNVIMRVLIKLWLGIVSCVFAYSAAAYAAESGSYAIVKLFYGTNHVDINNDGINDLVFFARRENFNAHGFDVVTFYIQIPKKDGIIKPWNIVPLFKENKESLTLEVSGGADCILNDFRLLKPKQGTQGLLIVAKRELSGSYYEKAAVSFDYYTLENNTAGEIGRPLAYFNYQKTVKSKNKYCDVNQAFYSELGLENYMERND